MDLFTPSPKKELPLSERMRPTGLEMILGQEHLLGEGKPLSAFVGNPPSLILWGPPGVGKTTLARLLAGNRPFFQVSAVLDGLGELRKVIESTRTARERAVLFVDEIHRWNKSQQDSLLPYLENGSFTLIGATTENPSFSLIAPLLSRARVFTLKSLAKDQILIILRAALGDREKGLGAKFIGADADALNFLAEDASGDARKALHSLEMAAEVHHHLTLDLVQSVLQKRALRYDKNGEQHYDLISAFIKSMRGCDVDASLYYFARMYEGGEDPRFLARRMVIFASEDVGMADPRALPLAVAAADAFDRVGQPEGWIPLSHVVVYLALAPKSNSSYAAYKMVRDRVEKTGDLPVPLHLRNAATGLLKEMGYGKGYEYAHDSGGKVSHPHLPEEILGEKFYQPGSQGFEKLLFEKREKS